LMMIRRRKHPTVSIDEPVETDAPLEEPKQIVDWCCLPETEMMSSEARAYMDKAIEQLPPTLRAVFLLRDIEGLSTEETSQVLDLSEAAVKTRLSRARMRLRELLTGYFGERLADQSLAHKEEA
jgi:RNA polymerase sigma-70 factor (ECF subfamily)